MFLFTVAQNLQNIIQEQIQTLSSGAILPSAAAASTPASNAQSSGTVTNVSSSIVNRPVSTSTAVSTASNLMYPTTTTSSSSTAAASASLSSNAQAALMILLTAQMQSQSGQPSVLQNPQVVSILQTLVNSEAASEAPKDVTELMKDPSLASVFQTPRPALLDTPKTRPILLGNPNEDLMAASNNGGLDNLLNTQNLNQLLGSLTSPTVVTANEKQPQSLLPTPPPCAVASAAASIPVSSAPAVPVTSTPAGFYQRQEHGSLMGFPAAYQSNPFLLQHQPPPQPQQHFSAYMPTQQQLFGFYMQPHTQSYQAQPQVYVPQVPTQTQANFATPPNPIGTGPQGLSGPQGLKRRLAIPPSPEPSPEGPYVGQHSQGIGGHYASSYLTKKAKKY